MGHLLEFVNYGGKISVRMQSEVKSKRAGPKEAPVGCKQKEFKICRSSIMQGEKYKIPLHQLAMLTCSSLHNPIVKAFPDRAFLQRCFPNVGWSPAFPWSSHVPFANPAGPPFGR